MLKILVKMVGKVMSYEDLKTAQAMRAVKEQAKTKRKRKT